MDWIEFSVQADRESAEAVAEVFHRFGWGGVAIEELSAEGFGDQPVIHADQPVVVKVYAPNDDAIDEKRRELTQSLSYLSMIRTLPPLQERSVAEEDWEEAWKEHFHVHRAGERTVIVPSWREYEPEPDDIVIELDPGMAFGTGLHPTTQLCVRELEKRVTPGMTVLDLGTGSGILAILANKLGATKVLALDTDSVAAESAAENVAANGMSDIIEVALGTLPTSGQDPLGLERERWAAGSFDIVVANILAHIIAELAPAIVAALKPGGIAICSGIIADGFPHATEALLASGAKLVDVVSDGDWRAVMVAAPE